MKHITETIWYSSQNLTTEGFGSRQASPLFWHGRAWLHGERSCITFNWSHGKHAIHSRLMMYLSGGDAGRELTFSVALHRVFSYFLTFEYPWFEKWMPGKMVQSSIDGRWFKMPVERQIGARFNDGTFWVSLWENPNEWNRSDPWWGDFHVNVRDLLSGRERRLPEEVLDTGRVDVSMPEGYYPAEYTVTRRRYKRPRWPWQRVTVTTNIKPTRPIPVPGKGENAWDCKDDAIFEMSCPESSGKAAALRLAISAMKTRERYGGRNWQPEPLPTDKDSTG